MAELTKFSTKGLVNLLAIHHWALKAVPLHCFPGLNSHEPRAIYVSRLWRPCFASWTQRKHGANHTWACFQIGNGVVPLDLPLNNPEPGALKTRPWAPWSARQRRPAQPAQKQITGGGVAQAHGEC